MDRRKTAIIIGMLVIVLCLVGVAWAYFRTDPHLAEVAAIQEQLASEGLTFEQRMVLSDQLQSSMASLSDQDRQQVQRTFERTWEARMEKRLDDFFKLSPAEQTKALDKMIDESVKREQQFQERAAARGTQGNSNGNGNRGGWGSRRNSSESARLQRIKERLTSSQPESRAKYAQYRQMEAQRRQQRGLPPSRSRF